jgi:type 1 fimbriae regulatory protein FimB/type 1 fimbriae regulatory protein FimE
MRALGQLRRDYPDSAYIFVSERGGPMTPDAARKMIRKSGEGAKLQFPVHPHMLGTVAGTIWRLKG